MRTAPPPPPKLTSKFRHRASSKEELHRPNTVKVLHLQRGWHDSSSPRHWPSSPAPTVIYELRGLAGCQHTLPAGTAASESTMSWLHAANSAPSPAAAPTPISSSPNPRVCSALWPSNQAGSIPAIHMAKPEMRSNVFILGLFRQDLVICGHEGLAGCSASTHLLQ